MPICRVCKKNRIQKNFYVRKENNKYRNECKYCYRKKVKENYHKYPEKYKYNPERGKRYKKSAKGMYLRLKKGANQRNLPFEIDVSYFITNKEWKCHYCGDLVIGKFIGSLDRVDNRKGYTKDNIVPCCWICNNMKGALTKEEFLQKCKTITERSK